MKSGGVGGESWCGNELLNTVTTDWVEDHLGDPEVALVDIRGRVVKHRDEGSDFFSTTYEGMRADYLDAHIPGAVFVDWTKDIASTDEDGVPAQLADRETFVSAMEERGIGGGKRVVVYDNGDMLFATRFWWAMRRFGHDRVSVMDGGWAKWQAERRDITPDCPCPLKVFTDWGIPPEHERPGLVACAADVRAALEKEKENEKAEQDSGVQLLDARASAQFTGEVRRANRGGHIPGAVNTPYRAFLTESASPDGETFRVFKDINGEVRRANRGGHIPGAVNTPYRAFLTESASPDGETFRVLKDINGIKEVFESASVDTSPSAAPVIAYCNGGVASTVPLFLLFQLRNLGASNGDGTVDASNKDVDGDLDGGTWANYDGSWNEWGNDESAPVER
eukprot:g3123.t1